MKLKPQYKTTTILQGEFHSECKLVNEKGIGVAYGLGYARSEEFAKRRALVNAVLAATQLRIAEIIAQDE